MSTQNVEYKVPDCVFIPSPVFISYDNGCVVDQITISQVLHFAPPFLNVERNSVTRPFYLLDPHATTSKTNVYDWFGPSNGLIEAGYMVNGKACAELDAFLSDKTLVDQGVAKGYSYLSASVPFKRVSFLWTILIGEQTIPMPDGMEKCELFLDFKGGRIALNGETGVLANGSFRLALCEPPILVAYVDKPFRIPYEKLDRNTISSVTHYIGDDNEYHIKLNPSTQLATFQCKSMGSPLLDQSSEVFISGVRIDRLLSSLTELKEIKAEETEKTEAVDATLTFTISAARRELIDAVRSKCVWKSETPIPDEGHFDFTFNYCRGLVSVISDDLQSFAVACFQLRVMPKSFLSGVPRLIDNPNESKEEKKEDTEQLDKRFLHTLNHIDSKWKPRFGNELRITQKEYERVVEVLSMNCSEPTFTPDDVFVHVDCQSATLCMFISWRFHCKTYGFYIDDSDLRWHGLTEEFAHMDLVTLEKVDSNWRMDENWMSDHGVTSLFLRNNSFTSRSSHAVMVSARRCPTLLTVLSPFDTEEWNGCLDSDDSILDYDGVGCVHDMTGEHAVAFKTQIRRATGYFRLIAGPCLTDSSFRTSNVKDPTRPVSSVPFGGRPKDYKDRKHIVNLQEITDLYDPLKPTNDCQLRHACLSFMMLTKSVQTVSTSDHQEAQTDDIPVPVPVPVPVPQGTTELKYPPDPVVLPEPASPESNMERKYPVDPVVLPEPVSPGRNMDGKERRVSPPCLKRPRSHHDEPMIVSDSPPPSPSRSRSRSRSRSPVEKKTKKRKQKEGKEEKKKEKKKKKKNPKEGKEEKEKEKRVAVREPDLDVFHDPSQWVTHVSVHITQYSGIDDLMEFLCKFRLKPTKPFSRCSSEECMVPKKSPGCYDAGECLYCNEVIGSVHCHELSYFNARFVPQHEDPAYREMVSNLEGIRGPIEVALGDYFEKNFRIPRAHELYRYLRLAAPYFWYYFHQVDPPEESENQCAQVHINPVPIDVKASPSMCSVIIPTYDHHAEPPGFIKKPKKLVSADRGYPCLEIACANCRDAHIVKMHRRNKKESDENLIFALGTYIYDAKTPSTFVDSVDRVITRTWGIPNKVWDSVSNPKPKPKPKPRKTKAKKTKAERSIGL